MRTFIKNYLREEFFRKDELDLEPIADFVNFTKEYLGITDDVKIELVFERTSDLTTFAYYDIKGRIKVYVKGRLFADFERSLAHELVHHKQNIDGLLGDVIKAGEDGSDIENDANARAGIIMRQWGRLHPEIYNTYLEPKQK